MNMTNDAPLSSFNSIQRVLYVTSGFLNKNSIYLLAYRANDAIYVTMSARVVDILWSLYKTYLG